MQVQFKNPFTKEKRPILIRPCTSISKAPSNDFPSPRVGMTEGTAKNTELLPYFTEDSQGRRIDSLDYAKAHYPAMVKRRVSQRPHFAVHASVEVKSFTGARMRMPHEEEEKVRENQNWKFDMQEVIRKARMHAHTRNDPGSGSELNLSHLNPLKCPRAYKSSIEVTTWS